MSRQRRLSPKERKLLKRKQGKGTLDTKFSMRDISPMTDTQEDMFDSYRAGYNIAAIGTAGTKNNVRIISWFK